MNLDKEKKIINKLLEKSRKSEIHWSVREDIFTPSYFVSLGSGQIEFSISNNEPENSNYADFIIFNELEESISENRFLSTENQEEFKNLCSLEELVQRYIKGVDETLDACLNELDKEGIVGG